VTAAVSELLGYQSPRLSHFPLFHSSLGDDAIDLAELAGLKLLPWQEMVVRASLGDGINSEGELDGSAAASNVCLITPRQNGKNFCVYVRELAGLFLLNERIIHTAHEFATADDAWKEMKGIVEGCDLDEECLHPHLHGGAEVSIRHKNGGFIRYRARGNGSMRGITKINLVIADEAFALDDRQMGSFKPIMQSADRRQLWLTSSAGFDTSEVLSRFRTQGIEGSNPKLLFAEWSCPEGSDPNDRENWKIANPSLGMHGIAPLDAIEDNFMTLSVQEFAREHLGMWDDPAMTSVIPFDSWDACLVEFEAGVSPIVGDRVVALDVAPQMEWASIVGAGWDSGRRSHVEVVRNDKGTDWVLPTFQRIIAGERPPLAVAVQAGGKSSMFGPELEQMGFRVVYFSQQEVGRATARFETDIADLSLTHYDDPHLKSGLGGADRYNIGDPERLGHWGWLRRGTSVDITGIVAASYANHLLTLESVEQTLNAPQKYRMARRR
jgi:phage terminase large subunit-like protein